MPRHKQWRANASTRAARFAHRTGFELRIVWASTECCDGRECNRGTKANVWQVGTTRALPKGVLRGTKGCVRASRRRECRELPSAVGSYAAPRAAAQQRCSPSALALTNATTSSARMKAFSRLPLPALEVREYEDCVAVPGEAVRPNESACDELLIAKPKLPRRGRRPQPQAARQ